MTYAPQAPPRTSWKCTGTLPATERHRPTAACVRAPARPTNSPPPHTTVGGIAAAVQLKMAFDKLMKKYKQSLFKLFYAKLQMLHHMYAPQMSPLQPKNNELKAASDLQEGLYQHCSFNFCATVILTTSGKQFGRACGEMQSGVAFGQSVIETTLCLFSSERSSWTSRTLAFSQVAASYCVCCCQ